MAISARIHSTLRRLEGVVREGRGVMRGREGCGDGNVDVKWRKL